MGDGKREKKKKKEKPWDMIGFVSGMHVMQGLSNAH